jgi:phage terminase large subunit
MKLTIPQTRALDFLEDDKTREVLFGGAAGPGKSTLGCYWQLKRRLKIKESVGLLGRSTLKTLKETTLVTFHRVAKMQGIKLGTHYRMFGPSELHFFNGSKIILKDLFYYPQDPDCDELGSLELTDAFVDEASQINYIVKNVLKSRIRLKGPNDEELVPKILYATNPGKNWTKTEFYDAAIRGVLQNSKQFVPALLDSNTHISKYYRENLQGLPMSLRERLLGGNWNYSDDPTQLMRSIDIENIFKNAFVPADGKKYITADIARMGVDKVVIRVWHGWRVLERQAFTKLKITESADKIKALANKYHIPMSHVMCDEDGIGGGVVDILGCKGFIANASPDDGYKNKNNFNFATAKDQCGWYLADRVLNNEVYEEADADVIQLLTEELAQIKNAGLNKDNKNKLVAKDKISAEIGRSPDDSDTYLMRAWFDLGVKYGPGIVTGRSRQEVTNRRFE